MSNEDTLPPLSAVRCFESAARLGTFTAAGEELGLTQAAVSYQIRQLEDRIGTRLFHRRPRGVVLTAVGQRFAATASDALGLLRVGFVEARQSYGNRLLISALPSFAVSILAPRLGQFQLAHPEISTRVDTEIDVTELLATEDVTIAIRNARDIKTPGLVAHRLMRFKFSPMLGPKLMEEYGPFESPADLLRVPRLDAHDSLWHYWFSAAGVDWPEAPTPDSSDQLFKMQVMAANAAMVGSGAGMLAPNFFREELRRGALIQPFDIECDPGNSIWLVYAERFRRAPAVRAFRDWMLAEMQRDFPEPAA